MNTVKNEFLPARINGTVTRFAGNGRRLGYPTANIATSSPLPDGVYFGFADLEPYHAHPAIIFIGTPTTVGDTQRRVEAYLLDAKDRDYYGLVMSLSLEHYDRPNQTFATVEDLIVQMKQDESDARAWFGRDSRP